MPTQETIIEAYCIELDEIIDIHQAQDAYFSQNEPRQRFNFLCSDEQCRKLPNPPKITGVNYSSEFFKKEPHFRRNIKDVHAPDCIWKKYNQMISQMLKHKGKYSTLSNKNIFKNFTKDIEATEVFDEFYIPEAKAGITRRKKKTHPAPKGLEKKNLEQFVLNYSKKTCRLASIVDLFRKMEPEDKITAQLSLPKTPIISYRTAFKYVEEARNYFYWTHVYYGEAKVYRYSKNEQGYRIFFINSRCDYNEDGNLFKVTAWIDDNDLKKMKYHKALIESLEYYSRTKEICCCYILGHAHLHKTDLDGGYNKDSVVIDQASSRFIVLRETSPHL